MSGVWRGTCTTCDNPPLITNTPSPVFLQQPITHNLVRFPGTSSKPHSQVLEIDPAQLETQSEASENTCHFPYSIHSHPHRPNPLCSVKLSSFFQLKTHSQSFRNDSGLTLKIHAIFHFVKCSIHCHQSSNQKHVCSTILCHLQLADVCPIHSSGQE